MSILDRYIFKTVFFAIVLVAIVLLGLDLIFAFIDQLEDVGGKYQVPQVINYVLMTAPGRIYGMISISVLIGSLLGLGALAGSSELVVMRAAGMSINRIIYATLKPIFIFLIAGLLLGQFVVPITEQVAQSQRALHQGGGSFMRIKQGNWHREENDFIHINAIEPNGIMHGITRYHFDDKFQMISTSFARRAIYQGDHWFVEDKKVTHFEPDRVRSEFVKASRWHSNLTPKLLTMVVLQPEHLSMSELYQYAAYLKKQGLMYRSYQLEFWQKMFQPLVTIVMVLLATSFVFGPLRSVTVGLRVMVGLVIGLIFIYIQEFSGQISLVFNFSTIAAALLPVALFFLAAVWMLRKIK